MGCAKNSVDSENMAGYLRQGGHRIVAHVNEADAVIINTCGFIQPAVEENIETILELAHHKNEGHIRLLLVTGCLTQRYQTELVEELPEVDAFIGTGDYHRIAQILATISVGERYCSFDEELTLPEQLPRVRLAKGPSAYVKIAEGCPRSCSYCIIPQIRGRLRSRSVDSIIQEVVDLTEQGVKEIVLVAQDTTAYGLDFQKEPLFPLLLNELAAIEGLHWIRFLYAYPELINLPLLEVMASQPKICAYLDLPLQHVSQRILKSMGRKGSADEYINLIRTIRQYLPEVALRSTFILGYPDETDNEFTQLLEFIDTVKFDNLAAFLFYPEKGARAAEMPNQVSLEVARERFRKLTDLQEVISSELAQQRIGTTTEVLVETVNVAEYSFSGRSYREAPEIDALIICHQSPEQKLPQVGEFIPVRIMAADSQVLLGQQVKGV